MKPRSSKTAAKIIVKRTILLIALCSALPVWRPALASDDAIPIEAAGDWRTLRDQGIHYYRRKLYLPAKSALEKAVAFDEGAQDFNAQFYLAQIYYELVILEKAFPAAEAAVQNAKSDRERQRAQEFLNGLNQFFGGITFEMDPRQKEKLAGKDESGFIHLEDKGQLINVRKKEVFNKIKHRFEITPVTLPITLYLPFGSYTANGAPFEVKKGSIGKAVLFLYNTVQDRISTWWMVGGGLAVAGVTAGILVMLLGGEDTQSVEGGTVLLTGAPSPVAR